LKAKNSVTISSSSCKILSVVITDKLKKSKLSWANLKPNVGTFDENTLIWKSPTVATSSVVLTNTTDDKSKYLCISAITVTYQSETLSPPSQVTFTPAAGTYTESQSVTLSTDNAGKLYYTTDGTSATSSSIEYTGAISVDKSMTINAYAEMTKVVYLLQRLMSFNLLKILPSMRMLITLRQSVITTERW
jgi:hypothetical protein